MTFVCNNLLSAKQNPDKVSELIETELQKGYLLGPFSTPPFDVYRINPIGLVQGKYSKKYRLIVDLSAPHNNNEHPSLNSLIDKEEYSLSYVRLDDAIAKIREFGQFSTLCKLDVVDAFKNVPIEPNLWRYHGIKWIDKYYFYQKLSFGSRSSPKIFTLLSEAIHWILTNNYGVECLFYLLDDFLAITRPSSDGDRTMALLTLVFNRLRVPIHPTKTVGPVTSLEYLGVFINSVDMKAYLPQEKLSRIISMIDAFRHKRKVTKRELLSLLGHMNFACRVIRPGRSFVSYLLSLASSVTELHHHVYINQACLRDMSMWYNFMSEWNGISFFYDVNVTLAADMQLYTDSSGTAFAGFYEGKWFAERWPAAMPKLGSKDMSIAYLELVPIVVSALLWSHSWVGKRILFHVDNAAVVAIITKGRSRSAPIMNLMRRLTWCSIKNNFVLHAQYIPTKKNTVVDSLSRLKFQAFRRLVPSADAYPTKVPPMEQWVML
ncbi:MAG: reverse transcriptase domain-containing protein [Candidatus Thiodiazotropha sp.]